MKANLIAYLAVVIITIIACTAKPQEEETQSTPPNETAQPAAENTAPAGEITKLSDLFAAPAKYDGQTIHVKGRVVKVNTNIMGRNWVHLDDGTFPGKDLTVTTSADVAVDNTVTMSGKIALNKDFGAGYKYEVIMEEAQGE